MPTKTRYQKLPDLYPPVELRDLTKARREWLATELTRLSAEGLNARIAGAGSYQHLSVRRPITVEGRLQTRGHCQYCGHPQAVTRGRIALHGYRRPGDGYTLGRCRGSECPALEESNVGTTRWLTELRDQIPALEAACTAAAWAAKYPVGRDEVDHAAAAAAQCNSRLQNARAECIRLQALLNSQIHGQPLMTATV